MTLDEKARKALEKGFKKAGFTEDYTKSIIEYVEKDQEEEPKNEEKPVVEEKKVVETPKEINETKVVDYAVETQPREEIDFNSFKETIKSQNAEIETLKSLIEAQGKKLDSAYQILEAQGKNAGDFGGKPKEYEKTETTSIADFGNLIGKR